MVRRKNVLLTGRNRCLNQVQERALTNSAEGTEKSTERQRTANRPKTNKMKVETKVNDLQLWRSLYGFFSKALLKSGLKRVMTFNHRGVHDWDNFFIK